MDPAGAGAGAATSVATVTAWVDSLLAGPAPKPSAKSGKTLKSLKPPPRRQPHRTLVAWISFAAAA
ncbi:hypothetical protein MAHJHV59_49970 [Mycobacterium avium subsp. hominissuis]